MGAAFSYFRKKKSTIEILEKLDQDIKKLEQFRRRNQERQKKFIAKLILYSIILYVVAALLFYFYYFPEKWKERLLYSVPLLLFPLVVWLVKKFLHWYFVKRIAENDLELQEFREKRKQILEEVMEKETYKKAKEILEKYDPARFKDLEVPKSPIKVTPGTELRHRQVMQRSPPGSQIRPTPTPRVMMATPMRGQQGSGFRPGLTPYGPRGSGPGMQPRNLNTASINGTPLGPPLPRPIMPRERGTMDRVLEYLVGDGPQNRYALICRVCHSHNGMALKEEFEYIDFRCCYCYSVNPARKKRPFAPRIELPLPPPPPRQQQTDSQDDLGDESDDDDVDDDDDTVGDDKELISEDDSSDSKKEQPHGSATAPEGLEEDMEVEAGEGADEGPEEGPVEEVQTPRRGSKD